MLAGCWTVAAQCVVCHSSEELCGSADAAHAFVPNAVPSGDVKCSCCSWLGVMLRTLLQRAHTTAPARTRRRRCTQLLLAGQRVSLLLLLPSRLASGGEHLSLLCPVLLYNKALAGLIGCVCGPALLHASLEGAVVIDAK